MTETTCASSLQCQIRRLALGICALALAGVTIGFSLSSQAGSAAPPAVVVSVPPLHSLVAGVMAGVGEPYLLLRAGASPHSADLRPSDARALSNADLVVWAGPQLEGFLVKPLETLATEAVVIGLLNQPDLTFLPIREGGTWERHEHGDEAHEDEKPEIESYDSIDPHFWLDPSNTVAILDHIARALSVLDPAHAERYQANAAELTGRLMQLDKNLQRDLAAVRTRPYLVFHDAYQYFERHYGLTALGAIAISPERAPGARRLAELRALVAETGAVCVFSEPQFSSALVDTVIEGSEARAGTLDPMGMTLDPGPGLYLELMQALAADLEVCLQPSP